MKLTKRELTRIIREVINEEDTISMDKLIGDRVKNMSKYEFGFLVNSPKERDSAYYERVKKLLKNVTGGNATTGGLQTAVKQHDTLWAQAFGHLNDPSVWYNQIPKPNWEPLARILLLKLATIAVGK